MNKLKITPLDFEKDIAAIKNTNTKIKTTARIAKNSMEYIAIAARRCFFIAVGI